MTGHGEVHVVTVSADELRAIVRDELAALLDEREPERPADGLLTVDELCRALRVSRTHLTRLRREPGFPELRLIDSPRFDLAAVVAWLKKVRSE